jgi:hypothetical protein
MRPAIRNARRYRAPGLASSLHRSLTRCRQLRVGMEGIARPFEAAKGVFRATQSRSRVKRGVRALLSRPGDLGRKGLEFGIGDRHHVLWLRITSGPDIGDEFPEGRDTLLLQSGIFRGEVAVALGVPGLVAARVAEHVLDEQILGTGPPGPRCRAGEPGSAPRAGRHPVRLETVQISKAYRFGGLFRPSLRARSGPAAASVCGPVLPVGFPFSEEGNDHKSETGSCLSGDRFVSNRMLHRVCSRTGLDFRRERSGNGVVPSG